MVKLLENDNIYYFIISTNTSNSIETQTKKGIKKIYRYLSPTGNNIYIK